MVRKFIAINLAAALAAAALIVSCGSNETTASSPVKKPKVARIGTWNLEWFGALGRKDRDIKQIAGIIKELGVDLLALQEITCPCTMEKLMAELEGYDYFLSPQRIPQKLALLWKKDRVQEVAFDKAAYKALRRVAATGLERESRQPLVFRMKVDKFDFTLVVVHLKSVPESEWSVRVRNVQYDTINEWLSSELGAPGAERDIIIAGDFNSYTSGVSSERLLSSGLVKFATANLSEGEYSSIWYDRDGNRNLSFIDHIAVTSTLLSEEFKQVESIRDWDVEIGVKKYEQRISDHLPVVAEFKTNKDRD